jgi:hypothetical protein
MEFQRLRRIKQLGMSVEPIGIEALFGKDLPDWKCSPTVPAKEPSLGDDSTMERLCRKALQLAQK